MEVIAKLRNLRTSPRKVRLVIGLVRGMNVEEALAQLRFFRKSAARPVLKLIQSAVANAEHNFKLDKTNLFIKKIVADGGPVMKRWRARAFGRAAPIRKRTCHVTVILDEKQAAAPKGAAAALVKPAAKKEEKAKPAAKKAAKAKTKE
jgi:large subunit ribosomal protein L22